MRILDNDSNVALKHITLYLTQDELREIRGDLESLISKPPATTHFHVNDENYTHEITVVTYDANQPGQLNQRSLQLLREDK